jgi:hypothetical protein
MDWMPTMTYGGWNHPQPLRNQHLEKTKPRGPVVPEPRVLIWWS